MSQRLVDTISVVSIFPPYSSDTESETSSESNESSPRLSCSIDTLFPPARSPSQSPPRFSFSVETFFPPAKSPSQSNSSGNYEQIFSIDPFISTSSRRIRPMRLKIVIRITLNNGQKNVRSKAMQIAAGQQGVDSVFLQGEDRSQIVVVGDNIDSVILTSLLRRKVGSAELTSVSPVSTEGEKAKQETKPSESGIQSVWQQTYPGVPYYYQPDENFRNIM